MKPGNRRILFYQIAVALVAGAIPWMFIAGSVAIGVLAFAWVLCGGYKTAVRQLGEQPALLLPMLYWLLFASSFFWSSNKGEALFDMQTKLPLLLLPLLIGCPPASTGINRDRVFAVFIASLCVVAVLCIGLGIYNYAVTGSSSHLFYHDLVDAPLLEVNAVYFSWYVITALSLLLFWPFGRMGKFGKFGWVRGCSTALLFLFLVLLASKTLVAAGCLLFACRLLQRNHSRGGKRWPVLAGGVLAISLLCAVIFNTSNPIRSRYDAVFRATVPGREVKEGKTQLHFTNLTLRTFLWETALSAVWEEDLWGAGAGAGDVMQVQKRQIDAMAREGYDFSYNENLWAYNLHNMYVQSLVAVGLPGVMLLLMLFFFGWRHLSQSPFRFAGRAFLLASLLFLFQESALQTQAGTVFFALFISFLLKRQPCKTDITN